MAFSARRRLVALQRDSSELGMDDGSLDAKSCWKLHRPAHDTPRTRKPLAAFATINSMGACTASGPLVGSLLLLLLRRQPRSWPRSVWIDGHVLKACF